jgi:hypothetical protein
VLVQHRLAVAIVLTAFAAVAGVFLFARPEYRQPGVDGKTITGKAYPAAADAPGARGWTWADGQPGFAPTSGHEEWNISAVGPRELDVARADTHRAGISGESIRLLAAQRLGQHDLDLLVSGTDARGATCIGAVIPAKPTQFFCPNTKGTHRLGKQVAFVVVAAKPSFRNRGERGFPMFVLVATRGDVARVVWKATYGHEAYHRKNWGWWGTFGYTSTNRYLRSAPSSPWRVRLDFYGDRGLLATLNVRLDRPDERLFAVVSPQAHSVGS